MLNAPNVQEWIAAIGWIYLFIALIVTAVAWKLASRLPTKIIGAALVLGFFAYWPVSEILEKRREAADFKARYDTARARFDERCKTAGEKITRTVDNVEGILLMKLRTYEEVGTGESPTSPGAAFITDSKGDAYLSSFLWFEGMRDDQVSGSRGRLEDKETKWPGFRYVEYVDPNDNKRYRYILLQKPDPYPPYNVRTVLVRNPSPDPAPRFGVTFDDFTDPEDRKHWVAGSAVKVIDLQSNEIIGQHIRYAFDPGLGSRAGARTPWLFAEYCPALSSLARSSGSGYLTRYFVDQVLKPKKGD